MNGTGGRGRLAVGASSVTADEPPAPAEEAVLSKTDVPGASNRRRHAPDLFDVGRLAGVSHQTVSRVVNNHAGVRETTRQRVLAAIAELGYRPSAAARMMAGYKSAALGIITTAVPLHGPSSILLAVESAAAAAGYSVSIASTRTRAPTEVRASLDRFLSQSVDGIIVLAAQDHVVQAVAEIADRVTAVVIADYPPTDSLLHRVSMDQVAGADLATTHLVDFGHRRIAHISGPSDWSDARSRVSGWEQALRRAALPRPPLIQGDWTSAGGYQAGLELIAQGLPDAVFVANDAMALGALHALDEHRVTVPTDIAVVGFDDTADAAYYRPALTTVRQDFAALGSLAVDIVHQVNAERAGRRSVCKLKPALVVRASSRPGL